MFQNAVRLAWAHKSYMYFVDVCPAECLDIARGIWLTGADYVVIYKGSEELRYSSSAERIAGRKPVKRLGRGGYSSSGDGEV